MTDQLRDTLTRIADRAEPAPADPTLWSRARRSRRRSDLVAACAVGAAVLALVATVGVLVQPAPDRPDPSPADRDGIPSIVRGVVGDGGLPLEPDLAVGAASVAIANPTGAFVVTADDGAHHRLDLPGFDPSVYDDAEVRRSGMVGLRLSPDGTRLAYGWHAPLPEQTGQQHGFVPSGVRILDLRTGRIRGVPEDRRPPGEFDYAIRNQGFVWGRVPYGLRWSADGRYLGYDLVWAAAHPQGVEDPHWGDDLGDAYDQAMVATGGTVFDTATGIVHDVRESGPDANGFWLSGLWWTGWPKAVGDDGTLWSADVNNTLSTAPLGGRTADGPPLPGGAVGATPYAPGLVDGSRRVVLTPRSPSSQLLAVDPRSGAIERLRLDLTPVRVDLLGWIDRRHALAQVERGEEAHLTVLDLSGADVESNLAATIETAGTESTFSFATDFATADHPTRDFSEADQSGGDVTSADAPLPGAEAAGPDATWWLTGLAAAIVAAGLATLVLRRRIRVD